MFVVVLLLGVYRRDGSEVKRLTERKAALNWDGNRVVGVLITRGDMISLSQHYRCCVAQFIMYSTLAVT